MAYRATVTVTRSCWSCTRPTSSDRCGLDVAQRKHGHGQKYDQKYLWRQKDAGATRRTQIRLQTTSKRPVLCSEPASDLGSGGQDLNLRPLGYERYDVGLWRLGQSLADAVTSADGTKHVPLAPSRLPRLNLFRRVRFTNWFTEQAIDLRFPSSPPSSRGCHPSGRGRRVQAYAAPRTGLALTLRHGANHAAARRMASVTSDLAAGLGVWGGSQRG